MQQNAKLNVPKKTKAVLFRKEKETYIKNSDCCRWKDSGYSQNIIFKRKTHDFKLFKNSRLLVLEGTLIIADKGYNGIFDVHFDSLIPIKATKNHKLTDEERSFNSSLAKHRIFIEHINRYIKRFKILSYRYRNKRRRFALRASLICSIYNFQHAFWGFRTGLI